jgi:3-oxoacyl-[acyl-carrier-protein] synthase III
MTRSRIAGTGRAIPPHRLTNVDLERMVDTSDAWITERTGIKARHILDRSLATSDLATEAGLKACKAAGIEPSELDCIIVGTVTPDVPFPSTAVYVQKKIGARAGIAAFDLSAACAGFIYGLSVADGFVARGSFKRILVIGVEILSRIVDWTDRGTCVLFGDGAGAVVLVPSEDDKRGILSTHIHADGNLADILNIPAGGSRMPMTADLLGEKKHLVKGREVFKHAVKNIASASMTALETNGLTTADVDCVIAHQANLRIIEGVAERLHLPLDKFFLNIEKYGNTSSASIPIALDEAVEQGRVKQGDLLLFSALGGGLAWGSAAVRW